MIMERTGRATISFDVGEHTLHSRYYIEGAIETSLVKDGKELTIRPDVFTEVVGISERKV